MVWYGIVVASVLMRSIGTMGKLAYAIIPVKPLLYKCYEFQELECTGRIEDNTIWAGCAHGLSFFVLNALISQCAGKRKVIEKHYTNGLDIFCNGPPCLNIAAFEINP